MLPKVFKTKKALKQELCSAHSTIHRLRRIVENKEKENNEIRAGADERQQMLHDAIHETHGLCKERDALLKANGDLKREADKHRAENERLTEQLMRAECPDDCWGHTFKAPGGSYCRACVRNPHARDKYRKGETT